MALSRISRCPDLLTVFNRNLQPIGITSYPINTIFQWKREMVPSKNQMKILHVTSIRRYPDAPTIPLPNNVSEIFANETGRFTPERARDIASPILIYGANKVTANNSVTFSSFSDKNKTFNEQKNFSFVREDIHVDSYDCTGTVSLNGSMQSNVPKPFCSTGKSTHFNMPGGQWAKDSKYIAEDMQKSNYKLSSTNILSSNRIKNGITNEAILMSMLGNKLLYPMYINRMRYSTNSSTTNTTNSKDEIEKKIIQSKKERLKIIVRDYGKVVLVFHIAISLASLGFFYTVVVSGINLEPYLETFIDTKNEKIIQLMNNSSGFLLAYGIHKLFAPIRLSITCGVTPWLILYLRKKGFLKTPKLKKIG
ncbi:PREDICTED: uncharacterized protein LOC106784706 [Polistes canadensis]|uniref:uncharacterized protein LOC106784706 n=1 Tax=Polistes canadensis TaxID=91411 RepID=UPI00071902C8|nr:PREDICTED: uncharacterized protein LOC106784706 [Polistes canadensis]XP_014600015.1 PREDICTED: uncharacterized protein LOC106784706 [Polistes canadensis]XP_014600016.1 PREDICTED: uncharacterized protein LOC106784706 [Polistes canadensis]XP_014600017.1 PREDICTED: uncharacterized protein LOC106784706 [Polistes canadensis]XP_014600018.1 PREDICTED: uncharacterized protein LOC106784706 [Polistes canadensis]XP_014600019.1 PREDICTED: uncharacterized protein LOC106784706 [Polistes canadensis]